MIEEILDSHEVRKDWYRPDMVMIHDGNYPLLKRYIEGKEIRFPADRIIAVADHFSPPSKEIFAKYLKDFERFVDEHGIRYHRFEGISHEIMLRYVKKGMFIVGLDSHSTAYGALGALSIGSGAMDMARILLKGEIWIERPRVSRGILVDDRPPFQAFDLGLYLISVGKFDGLWLEMYIDEGAHMDMEGKLTLATMLADAGAVTSVIKEFTREEFDELMEKEIHGIGSMNIGYMIAPPGELRKAVEIDRYAGIPIDQAFIGSCMGGRLGDLRIAAKVLESEEIKARLIVSPVSMDVYEKAMKEGIIETLISAGAVIVNPSCGTCAGIDKGMLAPSEKGVFTTTRNSKGRHGGEVFSASPFTAAVSALLGKIPSKEELDAFR